MAVAIKTMLREMQTELEKLQEEVKAEEGQEEEKISRARAENNEESWSRYGTWRGWLQAKREEVSKLEKKWEGLKKIIEEEERKEADKTVLEGGNDGLDEEVDAEKEAVKKDTQKLMRMM